MKKVWLLLNYHCLRETLLNIWGNTERFVDGYLKKFPGYYFSGDGGYKDEDGYVYITGRVDDVINVAGHQIVNC